MIGYSVLPINMRIPGHEIVAATIYDTEFYISDSTRHLDFFQKTKSNPAHCNMYTTGVLPNPQSFLIQTIAIHGITTNLRYGAARLEIGCKHYGVNPAWTYGIKSKGFRVNPSLYIDIWQYFRFSIDWEVSSKLGNGISGKEIINHPIQVVLFGLLSRPIQ